MYVPRYYIGHYEQNVFKSLIWEKLVPRVATTVYVRITCLKVADFGIVLGLELCLFSMPGHVANHCFNSYEGHRHFLPNNSPIWCVNATTKDNEYYL